MESEREEQLEPQPIRRSQRVRQKPLRYGIDEYADSVCQAVKIEEPTTIEEALSGSYSEE